MLKLTLNERLSWIFRILMFCLLATLLISPELWMSDRNFPLVPIFGSFIPTPYPIDYLLYAAMITLSLLLIIYNDNKILLISLTSVFGFLLLADQMRWQSFNITYFVLCFAFLFKEKNPKELFNLIRISIAFYMIWSGIQNINHIYFDSVFPWIFEPLTQKFIPKGMQPYFNYIGYSFPFIQIFSGIALFIKPLQKLAIRTAIVFLGILFLSLSPIGHNWNKISLPYLGFLISLLYFGFEAIEINNKEIFRFPKSVAGIVIVLMFVFLPILNFFNIYDNALSFRDFSGKGSYCKIYISDEIKENIPDVLKQYVFKNIDNKPYFDVYYWSMFALKVAPYSEERVFYAIEKYFCTYQTSGNCETKVVIYTYDNPQ